MAASQDLKQMVRSQLLASGIRDRHVLGAFLKVDRRCFVPVELRAHAYDNCPLLIGRGQTISQPLMVADMLQELQVHRNQRVLEVGSGSGYVLALIHAMGAAAFGIERHPDLAERARGDLGAAGYTGIRLKAGDGTFGWADEAPFQRILISAACPHIPPPLLEQLLPGGILVAPVGGESQQILTRITRLPSGGFEESRGTPCVFVPLIGKFASPRR